MTSAVSRAKVIESARKVLSRSADSTMEEVAQSAGVSLRTLYRLFENRDELLKALNHTPPPPARESILEAALDLLAKQSLGTLSMDELATAAEVSRATLYRLFPGKSALFKALIQTYSPWESVAEVLESTEERAPERLMPLIAQALARALTGRTGVLLRMVFEMIRGEPDAVEGIRHAMTRGLPDLIQYLGQQTSAGRIRRTHPIIAFQLLAGPIFVHVATRPLAAKLGFNAPLEDVVRQMVEAWLRAMLRSR
jgi:AcrR family transcriptional regulator